MHVDAENGLHYNWSRYYEPSTSTYFEPDGVGLFSHLRPYAYADQSPLRFTDPTGDIPVLANTFWPGGSWTVANALKVLNASLTATALNVATPGRASGRWLLVGLTSVSVWVVATVVGSLLLWLGAPSLITEAVMGMSSATLMPALMNGRLMIAGPLPMVTFPSGVLCLTSLGGCGSGPVNGFCGATPFADCFFGTVNLCPQRLACDAPGGGLFTLLFGGLGVNPFTSCTLAHEAGHSCGAPFGAPRVFPEILADDAAQAIFGTGAATGMGCSSGFLPTAAAGVSTQRSGTPGVFGFTPP